MADDLEERHRQYGRKDRGGCITLVKAVDHIRDDVGAFDGDHVHPDRMRYKRAGDVLVCCVPDPTRDPGWGPWQAGRTHRDGVHREERLWPRRDFVAFRDPVVRRDRHSVQFLMLTGCRKSEIVRLKKQKVFANSLRLPDSKTGSQTVFLNA